MADKTKKKEDNKTKALTDVEKPVAEPKNGLVITDGREDDAISVGGDSDSDTEVECVDRQGAKEVDPETEAEHYDPRQDAPMDWRVASFRRWLHMLRAA